MSAAVEKNLQASKYMQEIANSMKKMFKVLQVYCSENTNTLLEQVYRESFRLLATEIDSFMYNVKDDANAKARVKVDLKHLQQQIAEL